VIRGVALLAATVALAVPVAAAGFAPTDPLAGKQWYLGPIRAFDFWPEGPPVLPPVRVAVVDSGIDLGHPEFAGKVVLAQSFVGGDVTDRQGHGTFVAGIIAAAAGNGQGISGIALSAQLLVAKVVRPDGTISPAAEAKAIRWAANNGARVINLSLGGLRSRNKNEDTYSSIEQDAIDYAYAKGAVLVAAVGNGDQAPKTPWDLASYPAALPHVIGVGALARDGSVPDFSDRDPLFVDITAPGEDLLSTFPRQLTAVRPACPDQGYSDCGPDEYRFAEGTSFAAPQVSAAAALLIAVRPDLRPEQVSALLEHSAQDVNPAEGCRRCPLLRDSLSGWGRLDITSAVIALEDGPLPPDDSREPNDQAGVEAATVWGIDPIVNASLDYWDDPVDVYRIRIRQGQRLVARSTGTSTLTPTLVLWKPGTTRIDLRTLAALRQRAAVSTGTGQRQILTFRSDSGGWYFLEVRAPRGGYGGYRLELVKS
jgi:Subtilase family